MRLVLTITLCLVLFAGTALADRTATITRLDETDIISLSGTPRQCLVGNLNDPFWVVGDWFVGEETYKYLFNAADCCQLGFDLIAVHMVLAFDATMMYPIEFEVYADMEEAVWDPALGCWVPGPEVCVSAPVTVTIDAPGLYDIPVPIDCNCAFVYDLTGAPYWYMLSMHFPTPFTANVITDEFPVGCTSWNNWGVGWFDLVIDVGFPGEILMYGEVECCEFPVATDRTTWGGVKSLYH